MKTECTTASDGGTSLSGPRAVLAGATRMPSAPVSRVRPNASIQRLFEILPTGLVWLLITAPIWGAVFAPDLLGVGLVLFSAYWFWKSLSFALGVVVGYWRLHGAQRRNWAADADAIPGSGKVQHVVMIPTYGESEEILADTLHHLVEQTAGRDRINVVLAFEERDAGAPARAAYLTARFAGLFGQFLVTFHPDLPGEVKGKSSNLAWASRRIEEEWFRSGLLNARETFVTVCDADSRLDPQYLAALTHEVLARQNGRYHVYQPAILFYANHWRLPAPLRALNSIYSLWELARMVPHWRLVTQSTYSLTWSAAREVGYWDVDIIPEDSHMFFKVLYFYGKRVKVHPIFLPVYADAAEGPTLWRTLANQYRQIQRWAWGVSDVPYVAIGALTSRAPIPWRIRLSRIAWYVEEHIMWPSHWFLLVLGGAVPPLLNPGWAASTMGQWQAGMATLLLGLTFPCLAIVIFVDWRLRPEHPDGEGVGETLIGWSAYLLLPIMSLPLSALPALDAHTRLLFGRYLEYRVTEKVPVRSHFRGQAARPSHPVPPFEQVPQHPNYAPSSAPAVTDPVLGIRSDLR